MPEVMEIRMQRMETEMQSVQDRTQGLRESFLVAQAEQRATNAKLTDHADEMKSSTGAITKEQIDQGKKIDLLVAMASRDEKHSHEDWTDHGGAAREMIPHQSSAGGPSGLASQMNSLDSRWVALIALAILITGGVVSTTLAESIWQFFSGAS